MKPGENAEIINVVMAANNSKAALEASHPIGRLIL